MAIIGGSNLGIEICEILGIKPEEVYQFSLLVRASAVTEVVLCRYVKNDEGEVIKRVLERYKVTPL